MTNYIEEMMKTAGVNLLPLDCDRCGAQGFALGQCAEVDCKRAYPDFTTEKQIEIIKLIIKSTFTLQIWKMGMSAIEYENVDYDYNSCLDNFEQDLAHITTQLMNAGELDKSKVKEILER